MFIQNCFWGWLTPEFCGACCRAGSKMFGSEVLVITFLGGGIFGTKTREDKAAAKTDGCRGIYFFRSGTRQTGAHPVPLRTSCCVWPEKICLVPGVRESPPFSTVATRRMPPATRSWHWTRSGGRGQIDNRRGTSAPTTCRLRSCGTIPLPPPSSRRRSSSSCWRRRSCWSWCCFFRPAQQNGGEQQPRCNVLRGRHWGVIEISGT